MEVVTRTILVGLGATALLDLWALARQRLVAAPLPDYGLVGRWLAWMPRGVLRHEAIARTPAIAHERAIGWVAHYVIGVAFAGVTVAIGGREWLEAPSAGLALLVGLGTVVAPFLLMQPGMGAGIAARRTPRPWAARRRSLATHLVFGVGLYAAALAVDLFFEPWS